MLLVINEVPFFEKRKTRAHLSFIFSLVSKAVHVPPLPFSVRLLSEFRFENFLQLSLLRRSRFGVPGVTALGIEPSTLAAPL
jgi:hypothetical protein